MAHRHYLATRKVRHVSVFIRPEGQVRGAWRPLCGSNIPTGWRGRNGGRFLFEHIDGTRSNETSSRWDLPLCKECTADARKVAASAGLDKAWR